ncbi:MAG: hypothetical protein IK131_07705 [Paludibacteraceae bacterium]|nr:hypothetical protein [Paludibacteraceae bacterium]MBR5374540.1 hypothetical protein [Paludibacteraceae bacterium]
MKNILYKLIFALPLMAMCSCVGYYDNERDEDLLVGDPWHWTKTVYHDEVPGGAVYTDYAGEELSLRFHYDGDLSIKSTFVSRFGRIYSDWDHGVWDCHGGELRISTRDGEWYYDIDYISDWSLTLVYYDSYVDEWGYRIDRRVEEHYER